MKQKLTGILSLTAILTLVLVLVIVKWKEILVGAATIAIGIACVLLFVIIIAIVGTGFRGGKWDKE
jgi:hypothetical protein